jgi:hypothetical protein
MDINTENNDLYHNDIQGHQGQYVMVKKTTCYSGNEIKGTKEI